MKPGARFVREITATGQHQTVEESIESLYPSFVEFELKPRWWATAEQRPMLVQVNALPVWRGGMLRGFGYKGKIERLTGTGTRVLIADGVDLGTARKLWIWSNCYDTILFTITAPASVRRLGWRGWVYSPRLRVIASNGHAGDMHTLEYGQLKEA